MWNGKVVSVQTFCVSADYHTSHKIGFRLGEEYPPCSHAFFPFLKRQRFVCEISILSQWREEHIGASRAHVKTPLIFLHWIVFPSSFASFLGFFSFQLIVTCFGSLGNCDSFGNRCVLYAQCYFTIIANTVKPLYHAPFIELLINN